MSGKPQKTDKTHLGNYFYKFEANKEHVIIISTNGHLQIFQNSSIYKWTGIDPKKIIEDENSVIPVLNAFNKKNYYTILNALSDQDTPVATCIAAIAPDASSLIIAGKEIKNIVEKANFKKPVKKVILGSLAHPDVARSMNNPGEFTFEDKKIAEIEYLRSYIDAIISFSVTQEITYTFKRCLDVDSRAFSELRDLFRNDIKDGKNFLIPMSRAQALILKRMIEAERRLNDPSGEPDNHVQLRVSFKMPGNTTTNVLAETTGSLDKEKAKILQGKLLFEKHVRIKNVNAENLEIDPPRVFNLPAILEYVSGDFGFPTTYTYKILLDLYHAGIITYPNLPRISHDVRIDHEGLARQANEIDEFEDAARRLQETVPFDDAIVLQKTNERVERGICPIVALGKDDTYFKEKPNHWKIYSALFNRYLMQLFPPVKITKNNVKLDVEGLDGVTFPSCTIVDEGFHQYFKDTRLDDVIRFDVNVLKSMEVASVEVVEPKMPDYYTDASLLKALEPHVDAVSYLLMIEKLISNNYIQVVNKNLKLTKRGMFIATFLEETFDFLGGNEFTEFFSQQLQSFEPATEDDLGRSIDAIKRSVIDRYLAGFTRARERTNEYLLKQGVDFDSLDDQAGRKSERRFQLPPDFHVSCAECGSPMKVIETKTRARFLACENRLECGKTAALPRDGKVTVLGKVCALCNKHALKIESEQRGTYFFCPTCWMEAYKDNKPGTKGICATCDEATLCWLENQDGDEHDIELMVDLVQGHKDAFETCPRCQVAPMVLLGADDGKASKDGKLVCENPFCNYIIPVPRAFMGKLEKTTKKCLICPMNAVLYKKTDTNSFYVCLNCYNVHLKNKSEEIGFCTGCVHHAACFNDDTTLVQPKESILTAVKKRLDDLDRKSHIP